MKKIQVLILSLLMCGLMGIPAAYAQEQGYEMMQNKGHALFKRLNLTEEQKKQLESNKQHRKEQMKALSEQMKSQKEAMRQELMKKDLDMAKINTIQSQIKNLQNQISDNHLNSILEVRKILTPEQFNRFISFMESRMLRAHKVRKHYKDHEE